MSVAGRRTAVLLVVGLAACNCGSSRDASPPAAAPPQEEPHPRLAVLAQMRAKEDARLDGHDFAAAKPWSEASGANPFLIHRVGEDRFVGAMRAPGSVVLLDGQGKPLGDPVGGVPGISGWAWSDDNTFFAVGERSRSLHKFAVESDGLRRTGTWPLQGVAGVRDVAMGGKKLFFADRHRGRITNAPLPGRADVAPEFVAQCEGAIGVDVVDNVLIANCLLSHHLLVIELDGKGRSLTLEHDGPIWGFDTIALDGGLRIAAVGVEDHPLDRTDGSFGYVDSFLFVYDVKDFAGERVAAVNVGAHGVVTPKWVHWRDADTAETAGYGSAMGAVLHVAEKKVETQPVAPGISDALGLKEGLAANPLLDGWVVAATGKLAPADGGADRSSAARLGEVLAFTTLMAPENGAAGKLSRFTCETCHFEGTVDGRTHHTGRGEVHATTKTIRGLFGNRPHFTRALDRTTSVMIDNEFSVASKGSLFDPWFTLRPADYPWLGALGLEPASIGPDELRASFFEFLVAFTPDANPSTVDRSSFSAVEERGAELFATHCESCHQARLRSDDPESRVPASQWEGHVFGSGAILWAYDERVKTGVEPYVHDEGARVPSLRRLWVKRPYFTNGSAADLDAVLASVDTGKPFGHAARKGTLSADERKALRAFCDLL